MAQIFPANLNRRSQAALDLSAYGGDQKQLGWEEAHTEFMAAADVAEGVRFIGPERRIVSNILEENARLPCDADLMICSPRYLDPKSAYARKWREYLKVTPRDQLPQWLKDDLELMRTSRGRRLTPASQQSMPPTVPSGSARDIGGD